MEWRVIETPHRSWADWICDLYNLFLVSSSNDWLPRRYVTWASEQAIKNPQKHLNSVLCRIVFSFPRFDLTQNVGQTRSPFRPFHNTTTSIVFKFGFKRINSTWCAWDSSLRLQDDWCRAKVSPKLRSCATFDYSSSLFEQKVCLYRGGIEPSG